MLSNYEHHHQSSSCSLGNDLTVTMEMISLALIALKLEGYFFCIWLRCGVDEGFQSTKVMVILSAVS